LTDLDATQPVTSRVRLFLSEKLTRVFAPGTQLDEYHSWTLQHKATFEMPRYIWTHD